jgi:dipeptidyl aminopeptidase/acylaminoacyl peptidase
MRIGLVVMGLATGLAGEVRGQELRVADFSRPREVIDVRISPGGTYLAALMNRGRESALVFFRVADVQAVYTLRSGKGTIFFDFAWANEERVVIELGERLGYLDEPLNYGEYYAINADGRRGKLIFGFRAGRWARAMLFRKVASERAWGQIVDLTPADPESILVKSTPMTIDGEAVPTVYELDVYSGVKRQVAYGPLPRATYLTDENGKLRIAIGSDSKGTTKVFSHTEGKEQWRESLQVKEFTERTRPVRFHSGTRSVYVYEPDSSGIYGVYVANLDTGERTKVFQSPEVDPYALVTDPASGKVVGVEHHPDFPKYWFVDLEHPLAKLIQGLLAAFKGQHVRITSTTADGQKAIALVYSDRNPGAFYLVDTRSYSAKRLLEARKWIRPENMAEMTPFRIQSSDKLILHGYLTLPNGIEPRALPAVVLPHGGPHGVRDEWEFDPEAQLLASRGYAVLQLNYRGSGGYGWKLEEAGYHHWGDRVQQDLVDATRWMIAQGIADPGRICTYGVSFGGYSAIQSAILAPELFRCAAGYAGIYDLSLLHRKGDTRRGERDRAFLLKVVGNDAELLKRHSPVANADKIKVPVFIAHGGQDQRAPIAHARALRDALKASRATYTWFEKSGEGHGFHDEANREELYEKLLEFLATNTRKPSY